MYDTKIGRIKENRDYLSSVAVTVVKQLVAVLAGFFSSAASVVGLSPFGVSLCACIQPEYIPAAVLGSAFGYFYVYDVTVLTLRYIGASAVAGIISYISKRNLKKKYQRFACAVSSFVSVFVTGIILSLSVTVSADEFILYFAEGIVSAAGAWFVSGFLSINPSKRFAARLTLSETATVLVVFALIMLSLGSFSVFMISPAVAVGVYVVLVAAAYGGDRFACVFGIVAAAMTEIIMPDTFLTGSIALGGLLASFFGRQNKFFVAMIFSITVSVSAFASDDWINAVYVLSAVGIGCTLFVVTPKRLSDIYRKVFTVFSQEAFIEGQKNVLKMRLRTASEGMDSVTASVKAIAGIYRRRSVPREESVFSNVAASVCKNCKNYDFCWNRNYKKTNEHLRNMAQMMRCNGQSTLSDIPDSFSAVCISPEKIIKAMTFELERFRYLMRENAKSGETVNIVSDQFSSVSQLLYSFADSMEIQEKFDSERTGILYDVLVNDFGADVQGVGVFVNENKKIFCEINIRSEKKLRAGRITESASQVLGVVFEKPVVRILSDGTQSITVCERTKYIAELGGYQISSDSGRWCGDSFDSFYDGKGNFYMLLSDGMGTGQSAAADSVMCSSLASMLIRSGYTVDSALRMINSAMLVRSGEESLATLDIAKMNLYTGDVVFFKAGAAHSVVMKHQKMLKISKPSMPVGILGDIRFETVELSLREGDAIVLMSDGVEEEVLPKWRTVLEDADDFSGRELADRLAKTAHMNADKNSPDDITVVVARIGKQ